MQSETALTAVGHAIQLSVAPVFLLSGVGVTITVLTNRLSRIIDRARTMEAQLPVTSTAETPAHRELRTLSRRARLIHTAITLSVLCALLICVVIVMLFVGALFETEISLVVAFVFIAALCMFIGALVAFLQEIRVGTASLRFGP